MSLSNLKGNVYDAYSLDSIVMSNSYINISDNYYYGRMMLGSQETQYGYYEELYNLHDSLGSIITVESNIAIKPLRYTAFGHEVYKHENKGNYRYNGKKLDNVTGMYNYGYRDYNVYMNAFTTVDPIKDGSNWHIYCLNNPLKYVDPTGLNTDLAKWMGQKPSTENTDTTTDTSSSGTGVPFVAPTGVPYANPDPV